MAEWASVLVGRREELTALERALATVGDGTACSLALTGEPGIGKSRLLAELARRARERGWLVLEGRAAELERDLAFALLEEALAQLSRDRAFAELEDWQRRELEAVLAAEPRVSGERHRVARAVRGLLERVAAEGPVVLLLDDVHWADPASADVLALLLFRPPRAGVLLGLGARAGRGPALEAALAAAQ
jgi:predicted ATPase